MGSQFEQQFALQLPQMESEFGIPNSTYTAPDGINTVAGLSLRVQRQETHQVDRAVKVDGEMQLADILISQAQMGAVKPLKDGRFTVMGLSGPEVWTIATSPLQQNGEFICTCTRSSVERRIAKHARD